MKERKKFHIVLTRRLSSHLNKVTPDLDFLKHLAFRVSFVGASSTRPLAM